MQLAADTVLAGKYIVLTSLSEHEYYYMYLAKAPTLGEEFIITEFYPRSMAIRDENSFVTIGPEYAEAFESRLDKFTMDSRRLMHITANRFFGVREVLSEFGTAYAVSKKPTGELLQRFIERADSEENERFNDSVIDGVFDSLRSIASHNIPISVNPDTIYAENVGSLTFMYEYRFDLREAEIIQNMMKTLYCLITRKIFENQYDADWFSGHKYQQLLSGVLENTGEFATLEALNDGIDRYVYNRKKNPISSYIAPVILYSVIALILAAGAAYGAFWLSGRFLS